LAAGQNSAEHLDAFGPFGHVLIQDGVFQNHRFSGELHSTDQRWSSTISSKMVKEPHQELRHNSIDKGIWVTYRDGVYDITKFVQNHPGGLERSLGLWP
jgi:cytochrome b involved in lipid metabolism